MKSFLAATAAVVGLLCALPAAAQFQRPEDAVKYRRAAMTLMGTHFGRLGAMAQDKVPFDGTAAAANAMVVLEMSKLPFAAFVDGTAGTEKGQAKANIWTERAKFDEAAKSMQDQVVKLAAAAKENNLESLKAAFGNAGKACKACHDNFRIP